MSQKKKKSRCFYLFFYFLFFGLIYLYLGLVCSSSKGCLISAPAVEPKQLSHFSRFQWCFLVHKQRKSTVLCFEGLYFHSYNIPDENIHRWNPFCFYVCNMFVNCFVLIYMCLYFWDLNWVYLKLIVGCIFSPGLNQVSPVYTKYTWWKTDVFQSPQKDVATVPSICDWNAWSKRSILNIFIFFSISCNYYRSYLDFCSIISNILSWN